MEPFSEIKYKLFVFFLAASNKKEVQSKSSPGDLPK